MAKKGNGNGFFGGFDTVPKSNVDDFDRGFGLDYDFGGKLSKQGREKPLFQDAGFTEEYMRSRDNNAPEAISNNYNDEVSESDIIGSDFTDPKNQQGFQDMLLFDNLDNGTTRGVTDNFGEWWEDPMRHDLPGIDTMIRGVPLGYDSRKGKKAHDEIVSIFGVPKL